MKKIVLDINKMTSILGAHKYLQKMLGLPDYYGRNLDALYDCLTESVEQREIVLDRTVTGPKYLGAYGEQLLRVLQDAAEDNEALTITLL